MKIPSVPYRVSKSGASVPSTNSVSLVTLRNLPMHPSLGPQTKAVLKRSSLPSSLSTQPKIMYMSSSAARATNSSTLGPPGTSSARGQGLEVGFASPATQSNEVDAHSGKQRIFTPAR